MNNLHAAAGLCTENLYIIINFQLKNNKNLKIFLNEKAEQYEVPGFIENDPIQIPHQFTKKRRYRDCWVFNFGDRLGATKNHN